MCQLKLWGNANVHDELESGKELNLKRQSLLEKKNI